MLKLSDITATSSWCFCGIDGSDSETAMRQTASAIHEKALFPKLQNCESCVIQMCSTQNYRHYPWQLLLFCTTSAAIHLPCHWAQSNPFLRCNTNVEDRPPNRQYSNFKNGSDCQFSDFPISSAISRRLCAASATSVSASWNRFWTSQNGCQLLQPRKRIHNHGCRMY